MKLQVTILKKSKRTPHPYHIIVVRKSPDSDQWHPYNDTVHLYFDKGVLAKFIHLQDAPKGKKIWNPELERYIDLEPKHQIANEFIMKDGNITYLKEQPHGHFYLFGFSYPDTRNITFCNDQTSPGYFDYFRIQMNLKGKWREPSDLDKYWNNMAAEITEVYSTQKGKTCPSKNIKKNVRE